LLDESGLAHAWIAARSLRIADGPDEVHVQAIAKAELSKVDAGS
jgi:acyl-CoA dehydrogenase